MKKYQLPTWGSMKSSIKNIPKALKIAKTSYSLMAMYAGFTLCAAYESVRSLTEGRLDGDSTYILSMSTLWYTAFGPAFISVEHNNYKNLAESHQEWKSQHKKNDVPDKNYEEFPDFMFRTGSDRRKLRIYAEEIGKLPEFTTALTKRRQEATA
jgi:hypothetical protein